MKLTVWEHNEWPDGFYIDSGGQQYDDFDSAKEYLDLMVESYLELAKKDGRTIKQVIKRKKSALIVDEEGWEYRIWIRRFR